VTLLPLLLALVLASPPDPPRLLIHARLIPISGDEIERGALLIDDGRIAAIGAEGSIAAPEGAEVIDLDGKVVMPGLVCTHSHVGEVAGGDASAALHPAVRALDAIDVRHTSIQRAQAGGLTTAHVMPGSGHLMSGQTILLKLRDGQILDDLLFRDAAGQPISNMKMANGTNPRGESPRPGTRARAAAMVREQFVRAQEYREKIARAGDDERKRPPRDLGLEALVEILDGKRVVHHHTHRHDDIATVLRLKREFGFEVVLHHVSEAWKVADEIAAAGAACSIILVDSPGGKLETADIAWKNAAELERRGVVVGLHTDDPITDSRWFLRMAGYAVRSGMSRKGALTALTLNGARMLHVDDRVGTLEVGKDADLVVLDGDPLSVYTRVERTYVEGRLVFDRANPADLPFAMGGEAAGDRDEFHGCCLGGDEETP
jgi:imidazolonepropionase-like amidohydrolase